MSNGLDPDLRTDILSVLILFQTVCKGYLQSTKDATSKKIVKHTIYTCILSLDLAKKVQN